jgi:hypothetical protein
VSVVKNKFMGENLFKKVFFVFSFALFALMCFLIIARGIANNNQHVVYSGNFMLDNSISGNVVLDDAITGFAVHPIYSSFSSPEPGFYFNNNTRLLTVIDSAVYKTGYYSINGSQWTSFTLTGAQYGTSSVWLTDTTTKTLPSFGVGEHYIIIYSCDYTNGWDCYGNRWQLLIINNSPVVAPPIVPVPSCSDGILNQGETGVDCGGPCSACSSPALRTFYISQSGSDSNNGSASTPWKTLSHACASATKSGDLIHVNAGTYTETSQCNLALGVSIEGDGTGSLIKSHIGSDFTILLSSSSAGTNGNQHISNIKMDGDSLTGFGAIKIYNRNNVAIYGNTFVHFSHYAVGFDVYRAGDVEPAIYGTGNKFHDNIVNDCSGWFPPGAKDTGGEGKGAIIIDGQSNMLIYNNNLNQTSRSADSSGYLIKGVPGFNKDVKIYNNIITAGPYDSSTWDFAIELWYSQGGIEIYDNTITGSVDFGEPVIKGDYDYGAWVHDNSIGRPVLGQYEGFRGILLEYAAESVIIERNYFKNICQGIYIHGDYRAPTGFEDINIRYNIFNNIGVNDLGETNICSGIEYDSDTTDRDDWIDNFNVYNNVIIAHVGASTTRYGIQIPSSWPTTHVNIKNNIIKGFDGAGLYMIGGSGQTIDYLAIQNNILYENGGDDEPVSTITPNHYTLYNSLAGTNPLFVDISNSNFKLQSNSPAKDAGTNVGLTSDYAGNSVPYGDATDIGAYEYR